MTNWLSGISISICTRNRPDDLRRATDSVGAAARAVEGVALELIVVDDGQLNVDQVEAIRSTSYSADMEFRYVNKRERPGLLLSRIESVSVASHELLLFLDDDVEVEPDYLVRLLQVYAANSDVVGVGGVDKLGHEASFGRRVYEVLIGFRAVRRGRLSISGYGGGMDRWIRAKSLFPVEFVYGCNMSFRKSKLFGLLPQPWLSSYSLGEDLYLSHVARQHGPLLCDPFLQVRHYQSDIARDALAHVTFSRIVNHLHLLRVYQAPAYRTGALLATAVGFLAMFSLKAVINPRKLSQVEKVKGAARGVAFVFRELFRGRQELKSSPDAEHRAKYER
jgi:glycosyltransferase involved in cell wall biosynthesis